MNRREVFMPKRSSPEAYVPYQYSSNQASLKNLQRVENKRNSQPDPSGVPPNGLVSLRKLDDPKYLALSPQQGLDFRSREPLGMEAQGKRAKFDNVSNFIEKKAQQDPYNIAPVRKQLGNDLRSEIYRKETENKGKLAYEYNKNGYYNMPSDPRRPLPEKRAFDSIPYGSDQSRKPFESLEPTNDPLISTIKNLEILQSYTKQGPKLDQLKSALRDPSDDIRARFNLLEDRRKKELEQRQNLSAKHDTADFDKNLKKFYGLDEDEAELPSASVFKSVEGQVRFAKSNLKSVTHDPITGSTSNYSIERPKLRPLGAKPPEVFPGKIYDSPPQVQYELPKNTKKAPRTQIFNPLTGETVDTKIEPSQSNANLPVALNPYKDELILTDKIGKGKQAGEIPYGNPPPIYKGMGYKRSNVFA